MLFHLKGKPRLFWNYVRNEYDLCCFVIKIIEKEKTTTKPRQIHFFFLPLTLFHQGVAITVTFIYS